MVYVGHEFGVFVGRLIVHLLDHPLWVGGGEC